MNGSPSDRHNRLAREFVMKVGSETASYAEMMVVVESSILAAMLLLNKQYRMKPSACTEMVESAVHRATERFAEASP